MFEDEELVRALEEDGVTIMSGYLENVEEIFQMSDAYLFPTRSTENVISIPLSVMEALACGVPVIGYRSFENLGGISCAEGAVTYIDSPEEIDMILPEVVGKKSGESMLTDTGSWDDTAGEILRIISENV